MAYTPATSQAEPAGAADTPDRRPRPTGRKLTVLLLPCSGRRNVRRRERLRANAQHRSPSTSTPPKSPG